MDNSHMDITSRQIKHTINVMSNTDLDSYDGLTKVIISAAKIEHKPQVRDDYTLIGSTLKACAQVYTELMNKSVKLSDERCMELGVTRDSKSPTQG